MIRFFVKRPVTTTMFIAVFVVLGFVAFWNLRVELTPEIDFPIVTISVVYPGATPLEVETLVINKIEDAVSELSEVKMIRSQSFENFGYVFAEFLLSADVNIKFIEVKDKVEAIINDFPDNIDKPVVEKYDPLMTPVMSLVLSSDVMDGRDLYEFADKALKNSFSAIEGVANVSIYGGKKRQINVVLDPMLMREYYVTIRDIVSSIKLHNLNVPGGLLEKGDTAFSLRFLGEFESVDDIADMLVVSRDGRSFPLKEIGRVEDSFKKVEKIARFNGRDVVGLSLNKVSDGNAIDIARDVQRRMDEFRSILPEGVSLDIATNKTEFIISETNDTYFNILLGIILTVIILYFFTGRASLTFIAAIVIPTSLISSMLLLDASGFSINVMTLLAFATVLGTLIANAVIIVENVLVHLDKGDSSAEAAISGTKEVTTAILASAGTNLVVFTPIAFMGGLIGQFFESFGLTVVYATIFSIIASFSLTPMLCGLLLKKKNAGVDSGKGRARLMNPFVFLHGLVDSMMIAARTGYEKVFRLIFRFPKSTVAFVLLVLISTQFILPYVAKDFMPGWDADVVTVKIEMPQGSTISRTSGAAKIIEERIQKIPEMVSYLTSVGDPGAENAVVVVNLTPSSKRKRSDLDIINELVPFMAQIPDVEIMLERGEARGGMSSGDISINVYGRDYDKMIALSTHMREKMEKSGYFRSVQSSYKTPKDEVRFIPDQKRLVEHGLRAAVVGEVIRSSIYGDDSNVYKESGEEYDIFVQVDERYTEDLDDLKQINIISQNAMAPVLELGDIRMDKSLPMIRHRDKVRVIRLEGFLARSATGQVMNLLDKEIFGDINFEEGYGYQYVSMAEHGAEAEKEIEKAFFLAVILAYMLLCAIMNSFIYPFVILLSVVTSFAGVFYAIFFGEGSINIASMLGMVMIVGLVVNNSILLLDYAILKMKDGAPVIDALWMGASQKFRVIIMTSLAIVLGVMPQLRSVMPLKSSMGMVMIGGMIASLIFTFIFTPVVFWYFVRLKNFFSRNIPDRP